MVNIIPYEEKYAEAFRILNQEWLTGYGLLESHDIEVITDPKGTILDRGGYIYLAESGGEIVGTSGLMKASEGAYELVKMSVAPAFQGRGISNLLIEKCMDKARESGARRIFLYSNSRLQKAISLYEKYGFVHVPVTGAPFVTADTMMELLF